MADQAISLICTVRDEADNIAALLDSMLAQSRLPDEIVINDCGSRDTTAAIVAQYAARTPRIRLIAGGCNIASGRNHAIEQAAGPLIACTDAGLVLDRYWLERIIAPLCAGHADHVGGFFCAAPRSRFELALGATNYRDADEIDADALFALWQSMAFRKAVWQAVGGFPEWLSHCEDVVFDRAVSRAGYRRAFVADALVYFRPRSSMRAFARQYVLYARGDGIAGLWPLRHAIRYGTYTTLLLLLTVGWRAPRWRGLVAALLLIGGMAYTHRPYRRLWRATRQLSPADRALTLALVPVIRVTGDGAKMLGYPLGILRRFWR
ncbi:MAG: glycosyltransferase [Chloroflexaceae bacterium]|nr:glycosyltransferase [Chloroflexaceae bacterium]